MMRRGATRNRAGAVALAGALAATIGAGGCSSPSDGATPSSTTPPAIAADAVFEVKATVCGTTDRQRAVTVAVTDTILATVAHVFDRAGSFQVSTVDGHLLAAELVWLDSERDVALLALDEPVPDPLRIGSADDGDEVSIVSVVEGESQIIPGRLLRHVDATLDGVGARAALELEAVIERGESGSPVVGPDGTVVGMVFAASRTDQRGWALDASEISTALDGLDGAPPVSLACPDPD